MVDLTKRLPVELLVGIFGHVSTPDILRFKQVNRAFRDVILSSPLIQHKIDLYGAGFEHNPAAGIDLAESRKALRRHLSNLDPFSPVQEWVVDNPRISDDISNIKAAGGVIAMINESVRLFTLGSSSRKIPHKEWEIPLPTVAPENYGLYPGADIIAFVEVQSVIGMRLVIHLRTLSTGGFHPSAQSPTIPYSRKDGTAFEIPSVSVSSSRLVVLTRLYGGACMVIWDWKSSQVIFTLDNERYETADFIDDYRLLVCLKPLKDSLPCVVLMDTGDDAGGAPVQTLFQLPTGFRYLSLSLERGVHKPSSAECLAPFYRDRTQRIVALSMHTSGYLIFTVEALLRLAEGREGCEIGWDEWKMHTIIPFVPEPVLTQVWVLGCRLFCMNFAGRGKVGMHMYDFSIRGRAKYLTKRVNTDLGGVGYLASAGTNVRLPWNVRDLFEISGGHDSIAFFHAIGRPTEDNPDGEDALHIWSF